MIEIIIYRPPTGSLDEAMKQAKEFKTFEELQAYIINQLKQYMNLKVEDIVAKEESIFDDRTGWKDLRYLCVVGYQEVSDKEGFERYFGGKYNHPLCIGMFATDY